MANDNRKDKRKQNNSLGFLAEGNFGMYYRPFLPLLGSAGAVLLSELTQKYIFHSDELIEDKKHGPGWFYHTIEGIQERTGLTRGEQDTALKCLSKNRLIRIQVFGLPPKRHFLLNIKAIHRLYLDPLREHDTDNEEFAETANSNAIMEIPIAVLRKFKCENSNSTHYIHKEKEEEKDNITSEVADAPSDSPFHPLIIDLNEKLIEAIKKTKPDFKFPSSFDKWMVDIRRMLEIDQRSIESVREIIEWLPTNSFWKTNILSSLKLREQFDRLQIAKEQDASKAISDKERDWVRENTNLFFSLKKENPEVLKHMLLQGKYVVNSKDGREIPVSQEPKLFESKFLHVAGVRHG